ncbi:MAG: efflux RND transporter periplasmic adaptor subunit [Candidatus Cloacimonetes bacterium]|jgi:RND family efflux transporter MFP subunit|nr:efflux RND transporter periplasmic adaptor subunit [Candidatus Cloacimonadota bacterium]MDY0337360.1 efflux RND transporter periplasmic adaptor subunit [Candidatus Cloacimonadaceae bacterium]MCB5269927.1 efflux RND transporter periplasmic adaptor subunit [Candidatus Cloacimonadota bacterium]MCK9334324.1 efflux RND transporter periplasmic adaptor subunit [Candidatus Cloacimonadota bacterium]MDD2543537.1 efflux RND transporter periplasmic adaptor subunit [Candidatus Cloacimonadota bacterium]
MKKNILIPVLTLSMILILSACGKKKDESKSMDQLHSQLGVPVRVVSAEKTTFEQVLRYNAVLGGSEESTTQSMVSDVVTSIKAKVGDHVNKGDVIITFPQNTPSAQYEQASSAFQSIAAVHDRMQRLYEQKAISLQDYENVRTQYLVAKANLESSEQLIQVKAPISGVITNMMVNVSERVFPGKDLFTVTAATGYKTTIMIPETEISKVKRGSRVVAKWDEHSITGRISTIAMAMDPGTKAFRVEAEFAGRNTSVPYGVTAEIEVEISRKANVFVLERQHLVKENGDFFVWKAEAEKATRVPVEIGLTNQLEYEVVSGLSDGDMIITEGIKSLTEGGKIRIIEGS